MRAAAATLAAILAAAVPARAQAPATGGTPRGLDEVLRAEASVLDTLDQAVFEARKAEATARSAEAARLQAEARLADAESALSRAKAREADARDRLAATLRLHRAAEPFASATVQVLLGDGEDLARRTALLGRLSARQAAQVAAVSEAVSAAETAAFRAGIERASAWALAQAGQAARRRLDEEVAVHKALLAALERDRGLQARRAAEMDQAERDLARTVAERRTDRPGPVDFDRLRGRVPPPLAGARLAVPFGDVVHPIFHTRTPHPGLTFEFPSGRARNVRAAAFGRVAWVGPMRGLGTTVVVDHASGWFTVYGGLAEVDAPQGTVVREGTVLGRVAPAPGDDASRLYFELRHNATPVDPRPYLAR